MAATTWCPPRRVNDNMMDSSNKLSSMQGNAVRGLAERRFVDLPGSLDNIYNLWYPGLYWHSLLRPSRTRYALKEKNTTVSK
ncbi:hypothetical protein CDAR_515111, partial [Caerostris darwini]